MSAETSQPSEGSKDPVRIVYHTENRTFARLFNERSLEQVKDVVRRKLGLGKETSVSLKQMGRDALLDLEDDDDFQAFRVFVNSTVSVDIAVTVGKSQGPAVSPLPRENSEGNETTITSELPSGQPATTSQLSQSVELHPTLAETFDKRKRKVSFDNTSSTAVSRRTPRKRPAEPTPSKTTTSAIKPPVKRQRKEVTKKSVALEGRNEDPETSPPAKKQRRLKKDVSSDPKKSSADVETVASDADQKDNAVHVPALQLVSARSGTSGGGGVTSQTQKSKVPFEGVCAAVPGTSESAAVESEVVAAILSNPNDSPPEPPAKSQRTKKVTKKPTVVNPALPEMILPPCPICRGVPFHIRYFCPVFLKGPEAIQARLEELKGTDEGKKEWLINDLEGILRESKATSVSSLDTTLANSIQTMEVPLPPDAAPVSRAPNIPANSCLSEVTMENRNEGSSSESSDDVSDGEVEPQEPPTSRKLVKRPPPVDDDLEAVIRGPERKRQNISNVLDRIVGNEEGEEEEEGSDSKEDAAELEEDPDEESGRSKHRLSKLVTHSSDSESEEESGSPSPSRPSRGSPDDPGPTVQPSSESLEESTKQRDDDVVMKKSVGVPNIEGRDGNTSKETHVASDGRMAMDERSGEMYAPTNQQISPLLSDSVFRSSDARSDKLQEPGQTEADPTSDGAGGVSGMVEDPAEMDADPIEPVEGLEPPAISRSSDVDPIEAPSEDSGALFSGITQSTPKPGVTKRIKTRNGLILDDEVEGPVLIERLSTGITKGVTPLPTIGMTEDSETPTSQQPATTRKSPRFSSFPSLTSTPAAVALLNHRAKGARSIKAAKTPARRGTLKGDVTQSRAHVAETPSVRWESLAEPLSSPSILPDEPSLLVDELMSSPAPEIYPVHGRRQAKGKSGLSRKPEEDSDSQGKERLFDLTPSQIPFPYSQYQGSPAPTKLLNGKEWVEATDSEEEEEEPKATRAKTKLIAPYRPLSQLASQATLFSPSLPTPAADKPMANGKAKKGVPEEDSSSSSDTDEANGSEHIPQGRRAGSVLGTKKKGMLSRV